VGSARAVACIVLPAYLEAPNLAILLPRIFSQAEKILTHELYVLVVDDSSSDGTQALVEKMCCEYPHLNLLLGKKKGLGDAYRRGMVLAMFFLKPDLILQMDADLQHDPALLPEFINLCNRGYNLVIGSRFAPGGATPHFPWHRNVLSRVANRLARFCSGLPPLQDCTSGYRCIKADLLGRCNFQQLSARGYAFQTSLLSELFWNGARAIEIPIMFGHRLYGRSKLSARDYFGFLFTLAKLRLRSRERARAHTSTTAGPPSGVP